jgi:hypothetical protein
MPTLLTCRPRACAPLANTGIPLIYYVLLRKHKDAISDIPEHSNNTIGLDPNTRAVAFLWQPYKRTFSYWEVVECGRRLLLTGEHHRFCQRARSYMLMTHFAMAGETQYGRTYCNSSRMTQLDRKLISHDALHRSTLHVLLRRAQVCWCSSCPAASGRACTRASLPTSAHWCTCAAAHTWSPSTPPSTRWAQPFCECASCAYHY